MGQVVEVLNLRAYSGAALLLGAIANGLLNAKRLERPLSWMWSFYN